LFIFVSWTIAGAYTIVFRGGQRVELPDNFIVTSDAVIYETAPNVNVSFRLASIDVAATERANNAPSGSFLRRMNAEQVQAQPSAPVSRKATRTITNLDLEPFERDRVKSEADWEKRQKELGLPSREELRLEAQRREAALDDFLAQKRAEENENYWRERDAELRAQMAMRMNASDYQNGQYYSGGIVPSYYGGSGGFDSRFGFGRGFGAGLSLGSPCGFNPSASCLLTHPISLFNQGVVPFRRTIIGTPRTNGPRRGGGIFMGPHRGR